MNREVRKLLVCIKWDLLFAVRYQIVTVALVVTLLYTLILKLVPGAGITEVLVTLLFTDPTMLGFIFIGAMVLFEKDANTLQAITVTPIKPWQYLWSKAVSLSLISLFCGTVMAIVGHGWDIDYVYLVFALLLSSLLFIFIGFIGVARVRTFNQYMVIIPLFMFPAVFPLADFYGIFHSLLVYLIPTRGSLILFEAAFEKGSMGNIIYGFGILLLSVAISYMYARKHFIRYVAGRI